ncbi:DUF3052 domain-containing protein [Acidaminobacter sp. JC074]|uniref:hypothetical protein n=1 Tax=Acidaminobacter sp. JC074 TaxID=2530199 RepID=UPI001F0E44E5|nr:hypothetical protein [Acidaminobacter sp. JC074]MCH4889306.1 DUF3052 domain-containing protein [Acidaminobacter sp. JC074]
MLRKKLQVKDKPISIFNLPEELKGITSELEPISEDTECLIAFHTSEDQLFGEFEKLMKEYKIGNIWWFCYPKKSSKKYKGSDLSRDTYMNGFTDYGFRSVRQVSLSDDWTATRMRKTEEVKK